MAAAGSMMRLAPQGAEVGHLATRGVATVSEVLGAATQAAMGIIASATFNPRALQVMTNVIQCTLLVE